MQWSWLLLCRNAQWRQQNTEIQPQKKSLGVPFIIYADLECLLEKMHSCQNNIEKSYTEKKTKHKPSGYSLFTNCSFDAANNKLDCYRGKDCLEMRTVNYEKKRWYC